MRKIIYKIFLSCLLTILIILFRIPKSSIPVSIPQVPNLHRSNKDPEKCPTKNPEKSDEPSNQTLEKASEPGLGLGVALERYLDPEPEQDSDQRDSNPRYILYFI